jgi:hypothetical protein
MRDVHYGHCMNAICLDAWLRAGPPCLLGMIVADALCSVRRQERLSRGEEAFWARYGDAEEDGTAPAPCRLHPRADMPVAWWQLVHVATAFGKENPEGEADIFLERFASCQATEKVCRVAPRAADPIGRPTQAGGAQIGIALLREGLGWTTSSPYYQASRFEVRAPRLFGRPAQHGLAYRVQRRPRPTAAMRSSDVAATSSLASLRVWPCARSRKRASRHTR